MNGAGALVLAALLAAAPAARAQQQPAAPAAPSGPDAWLPKTTAELILLDRVRGQPSQISIAAGQSTTFGALTIALRACAARPPDQPQNAAAFIEVRDSRGTVPLFRGWILSNTPAVAQLEHPVYDLRLAACR